MKEACDVMIDLLRAIDKKRLIKRIGEKPKKTGERMKENIKIVLDLNDKGEKAYSFHCGMQIFTILREYKLNPIQNSWQN